MTKKEKKGKESEEAEYIKKENFSSFFLSFEDNTGLVRGGWTDVIDSSSSSSRPRTKNSSLPPPPASGSLEMDVTSHNLSRVSLL